MPVTLNKANLLDELRKPGTLSQLLPPEAFAEPEQVAAQLAEGFVRDRRAELKPTQLRKIFSAIKARERVLRGRSDDQALDASARRDMRLLIPELAYARGRELIPQGFYDLMKLCLSGDKLQTVGDLKRLVEFLTAILAYHKYYDKVKGGGS